MNEEDWPFTDALEFWVYAYACCIVMCGNMELSTEEQQVLVRELAENILSKKVEAKA